MGEAYSILYVVTIATERTFVRCRAHGRQTDGHQVYEERTNDVSSHYTCATLKKTMETIAYMRFRSALED